ncbi:MAG: hypothetical protein KDB80_05625 [Planctomycetes bacterium]|nr:hypothetical protein [Planctomycetota bacterium]
MKRHWILVTLLATSLRAQDFERVELRVISTGAAGTVSVDRGERDGLAIGDLVFFYPRDGGSYRGTVKSLDDRTAVVEMQDRAFVPRVGTRGRARVPAARRGRDERPVKPRADRPEPEPEQKPKSDPDRWENPDDAWKPGMPLLTQMKPVRPQDRGMRIHGRLYTIGEIRWDDGQDFDNSSLRVGNELEIENPFGHGGGIRMDVELDYRTEQNEQSGFDILPRRASYYVGGNRFQPQRLEFGRFLQHGMPEFGVLDGVEWGFRTPSGHRYGASLGYLPEPDDDFETLRDLQLAGHYQWVPSNNESFVLGAGYQKSFHDGKTDRDLFVFKTHYLPIEPGWRFHGSLWVDVYYGRDDEKGSGPEITRALAATGRTFDDGDSIELRFRRERFPELLRNEFPPLLQGELANNRYDRLSLEWRNVTSPTTTLWTELAGFDDEDDHGGAAEFGAELRDWLRDDGTTGLSAFGSLGNHTNSIGARVTHLQPVEDGHWDLLYEITNHRMRGFDDNLDDLVQQRVRAGRSVYTANGWSITVYGDAHLFDSELALGFGFWVQRDFRLQEVY